jgi:hexosaminidase
MIDTSRHFLKVAAIKRAIDAMMYSKLNVLHWHITDQDSFPLFVPNVPELSQAGSIGGVYSEADVKSIISYARSRAIRVVPEIDTPAHSEAWGRSEKYKNITLNCDGSYQGQLDPTLDLTWQVLEEVMGYVNRTFPDAYVHFGGDEVEYDCWGDRPAILEWMKEHGIADFKALSVDFRERQKQLWRDIHGNKKVIYWANEEIDLPVQDDDVIQWWGIALDGLVGRPNEVILSNYDLTYLDVGFGGVEGYDYLTYEHWRLAYSFNPVLPGINVIGGATCMWNEIGHERTFDQKVLQRASVIGERLWNSKVDIKSELRNIATRLNAHSQRFRERGYKVWPVTVGLCEKSMEICF